jgi:hypothetical protein
VASPQGETERGRIRTLSSFPLVCFLVACIIPTSALAHASDRGFVLLLPTGYYLTGGALAVAASFLALTLIPSGALERIARRRAWLFTIADGFRFWLSLAAFLLLVALVVAGFIGSRDPLSNPLPLTVWTLLWIGLTLVQGLFGDVWWWINPWHAPARIAQALLGRNHLVRLPDRLGYWPAVALLFGFAWFELVFPAPDDPYRLGIAVAVYFVLNLACVVMFGEAWLRRGECLFVFFSMVARFGVLGWNATTGRVSLGWPGAKLLDAEPLNRGGALFLLLALASVSFDGLSRTFFWLGLNGINPLEYPGRTALIATNTFGLALAFALLSSAFFLSIWLGERLSGRGRPGAAAAMLVWSIVPISLAYHLAHYLTALTVNGQYALVALSDPFARGWNLFGTADNQVSAGIVMGSDSVWVLWNLQAGAIIGGHVLAVLAAHLLACRLEPAPRRLLAELPLTVLMVAYTLFGLWLLSTPTGA